MQGIINLGFVFLVLYFIGSLLAAKLEPTSHVKTVAPPSTCVIF